MNGTCSYLVKKRLRMVIVGAREAKASVKAQSLSTKSY